ncbi:MAG TPA: TolC family protein, partial [Steroidobacteraceae bacterium]|nr:TolC family protein [Steroidobacteraceae bacterium]
MSPIRCAARCLVPVAVAAVLAGCAIGPNYKRPPAAVTESYKNPVASVPALPDEWWTLFNDPILNDLESQVIVNNQNIAEASAAYMQARAVVRQDRSNLLPSIDLTGGATRSISGSPGFVVGGTGSSGLITGSNKSTTYQLAASTDWELDVWGKLRRTLENARDSAQASAADLANAQLSARSQL